MRKWVALTLITLLLIVVGFSIAYGNNIMGLRDGTNAFLFDFLGPNIYGGLMGASAAIMANTYYQWLHPVAWLVAGVLLAVFGHTLLTKTKAKLGLTPAAPAPSYQSRIDTAPPVPIKPAPVQKVAEPEEPEEKVAA